MKYLYTKNYKTFMKENYFRFKEMRAVSTIYS